MALSVASDLLVPANPNRTALVIINTDASQVVFLGPTDPAFANMGITIFPRGAATIDKGTQGDIFTGPVYAIADGGTPIVTWWEQ